VLNSGVLGDPRPGARFDYEPAPTEMLERARRIGAICTRHGVSLTAAVIAFPLRHPAVTCVLVGARSAAEVAVDVADFTQPVPEALWEDLVAERLLPEAALTT
jgi:D-threo-aldose 1-dehydrogenase